MPSAPQTRSSTPPNSSASTAQGVYRLDGTLASGELFTFEDPEVRLPALDRLERFDPDRPSLYRRVLIPAETSGGDGVLAWAYVIEGTSGTYLPGGSWPP